MPVIRIHNPFQPYQSREIIDVTEPVTITEWLLNHNIDASLSPTLCFFQGEPLLRARWSSQIIYPEDTVLFITLPQGGGGGGGKNPLRTVLTLAALVISAPLGGMAAGALGITCTVGVSVISAGVAIAGVALVNVLVPPPRPSLPGSGSGHYGQAPAASPTYSLQSQGNQARLDQPIPVIYGRHRVFPDLAATPYIEYKDNQQFLYQLHCIGQGHYDVDHFCIGESSVASFQGITYEVIPPGGNLTLFDGSVIISQEVSGQEVLAKATPTDKEETGPFIANPVDTKVLAIGIDMILPRGLYYANNSGGLDPKTVFWEIRARQIDQKGDPQGEWITLGAETLSAATHTALRKSYRYPVAPGRYEVKAIRKDTKDTSSRSGHELRWGGLRAYLDRQTDFKGLTLLAIKMQASDQLSQTSARMVNCIVTRKLPTWNPQHGWGSLTPTRSIAWAFVDAAKATYGAKLPDSRLDLEALYALDQNWQRRGDTFDGVFDQSTTLWDALTKISRCGRAVPFLQGGIIRIVRDEAKTLPVALFSPRNIVHGSFRVQYLMPGQDSADAVTVGYFNAKTWQADEVTVSLEGSQGTQPAKVSLFGCTTEEHARREGFYMAAANRYRRRIITFQTELEGLIPTYGDLIAITHDMPRWGQGGDVLHYHNRILTTSEPLKWQDGEAHYLALRRKDGSLSGPWEVTPGVEENKAVFKIPPDIVPYTGTEMERTHYAFGPGESCSQKARVLSVKPRGDLIEITAVTEHNAVHQEHR